MYLAWTPGDLKDIAHLFFKHFFPTNHFLLPILLQIWTVCILDLSLLWYQHKYVHRCMCKYSGFYCCYFIIMQHMQLLNLLPILHRVYVSNPKYESGKRAPNKMGSSYLSLLLCWNAEEILLLISDMFLMMKKKFTQSMWKNWGTRIVA